LHQARIVIDAEPARAVLLGCRDHHAPVAGAQVDDEILRPTLAVSSIAFTTFAGV